MALDPKAEAALALHRFGFGPRAGSIAAIASDPRGALLAELDRPGAGLITDRRPADERRGGARRFDFRAGATGGAAGRARRAAGQSAEAGNDMPAGRRCKPAEPPRRRRRAAAAPSPVPARRSRSISTRPRRASTPRSAPRSALSSGWCGSGRTISASRPTRAACARSAGAYEREAIRAACARPLRRHAARGREPSGDAVLSRQCALDRPEVGRRPRPRPRPQREPRARDPRAAYARRAHGLHPGRRHQLRQGAHRLDHASRCAERSRCAAASSSSIRACTSRARRR